MKRRPQERHFDSQSFRRDGWWQKRKQLKTCKPPFGKGGGISSPVTVDCGNDDSRIRTCEPPYNADRLFEIKHVILNGIDNLVNNVVICAVFNFKWTRYLWRRKKAKTKSTPIRNRIKIHLANTKICLFSDIYFHFLRVFRLFAFGSTSFVFHAVFLGDLISVLRIIRSI